MKILCILDSRFPNSKSTRKLQTSYYSIQNGLPKWRNYLLKSLQNMTPYWAVINEVGTILLQFYQSLPSQTTSISIGFWTWSFDWGGYCCGNTYRAKVEGGNAISFVLHAKFNDSWWLVFNLQKIQRSNLD